MISGLGRDYEFQLVNNPENRNQEREDWNSLNVVLNFNSFYITLIYINLDRCCFLSVYSECSWGSVSIEKSLFRIDWFVLSHFWSEVVHSLSIKDTNLLTLSIEKNLFLQNVLLHWASYVKSFSVPDEFDEGGNT